jgi:hypothetical protein
MQSKDVDVDEGYAEERTVRPTQALINQIIEDKEKHSKCDSL